jgi:hypothetical protein
MTKIRDLFSGMKIPETKLTRPDEFTANKNHAAPNPLSLIHDVKTRFPIVPEMIPYHPALAKKAEIENLLQFIDQMFVTDWKILRHFIDKAREEEITRRVETRKQVETDEANKHAENTKQNEIDKRAFYFQRALQNVLNQQDLNATVRKEIMSLFDQLRKLTVEHADKFRFETQKEIKDGQKRHEEYWAFRQDNLWGATGSGGVSKLKKTGQMIEEVTGKIEGKKRDAITEQNWEWRKDNVFVTLPNGGMGRAKGGSGKAPEAVTAEVHQPLTDQRVTAALDWRASGSYVQTPNDSLMHMKGQGHQPEGAFAEIHRPKLAKALEGHVEEYRWSMAGSTPNGGVSPLYNSGKSTELAQAEQFWPNRRDIINENLYWHHSYLFKPTSNGNWTLVPGHGRSEGSTSAKVVQPEKDKITEKHETWRKDNLWAQTPNNGYARLSNVGHSLERISFEFYQPKKEALKQYHEQHHINNRFVATANHGWGRLKSIGADIEPVVGEVTKENKAEVTTYFDVRADGNLFVPTANDGIRRLPDIGERFEKISLDLLSTNKPLSQTDVKQFVRNAPDTSIDRGTGSLLVGNGRQSEEASVPAEKKTSNKTSHPFAEFRKNLAAHEQTTSAFASHSLNQGNAPAQNQAPSQSPTTNVTPSANSKKAS